VEKGEEKASITMSIVKNHRTPMTFFLW